jgi:hypothetical protein
MANPDIPAALVVLNTHLVAAGNALTDKLLDVDRGLPSSRGRQIRWYWGGEVEPPRMGGHRVLNGELVGQRFVIVACWPLTDLSEGLVSAIDAEMQVLAGEVRTRIQGDSQLGGNVTDLDLDYADPDTAVIAGARHVVLRWDLDLSFVEYAVAQ